MKDINSICSPNALNNMTEYLLILTASEKIMNADKNTLHLQNQLYYETFLERFHCCLYNLHVMISSI